MYMLTRGKSRTLGEASNVRTSKDLLGHTRFKLGPGLNDKKSLKYREYVNRNRPRAVCSEVLITGNMFYSK